jgi:hypothetical protein
MHMNIGVDSSGERSFIQLVEYMGNVTRDLTFLIVDCLPVFENPSKGFPDSPETEVPSNLPVADEGSSP